MNNVSKISIFFVLLFNATMAYNQCEIYLQKAESLIAQKNYCGAKKQYENYKECKSDAPPAIDAKIAECERLCNEPPPPPPIKEEKGISEKNLDEKGNIKVPRTQPAIGIGSFSGYKGKEAETSIRNAFVQDGRFIVNNVQNISTYDSNQQTSVDVDYIVSGTCSLVKQAGTVTIYVVIPETKGSRAQRIPQTIPTPEIVNVDLVITNLKGEIVVSTTYNPNNLYRIASDVFPIKMPVIHVNGEKIEIDNSDGGTFFNGDICKVYEEYSNGGKRYLGTLQIGKTYDDCKITDGKKEINNRFEAGAKLVVER